MENSVSVNSAADSETDPLVEGSGHEKARKRVRAESSGGSEPQLEAGASASFNASVSTRGRRKRKKVDQGNSTDSKSPPANDMPASSIDSQSNRRSPDLSCSICLCAVENKAFTNACCHTFCYECLVEWSRIRAVCPLCKKSFHSIIHSFRSFDDYKLYQVPRGCASNSGNVFTPNDAASSSAQRIRRLRNTRILATVPLVANDDDHTMALRRRVYSHSDEMQLRGLWSSDGVVISPPHQVSPAMFDHYPMMLERVRPWVQRDITVIIGSGDVVGITDIVVGLLRNFPITSEDFYERLFPYLGLHTRRFIQELDAFARSPFDMTTYDARVLYSTDANTETLLPSPTEHIEDISSSDDSDVEIVSSAVMPFSESAHSSMVGLNDRMAMMGAYDLLRCLQTIQFDLWPLMNRSSYHSGLESPEPGPSGLGQATVTEENESVGSRASGSGDGAEEHSNHQLVLSDADSDIVVVDSDRPVHSPIHISSEEDDSLVQEARSQRRIRRERRRIRRQRRQARHDREHGGEFEQSSSLTSSADCAAKNEAPKADISASPNSSQHDADEAMRSDEHGDNTSHMQQQSSSHGSHINLNDHIASYGKLVNTPKHQQHTRPKRSRSADSKGDISMMSVVSTADDANPLPCKKHIRGHKSSKQKAKQVVAENSSADVVGDNVEKPLSSNQVETTAGSCNVSNTSHIEQTSADILSEATVPSVDKSSILCASSSCSPLPLSSSLDKETCEEKLSTETEISVPCTSEMCSQPAALSSGSNFECTEKYPLSSMATAICDNANECSSVTEEVANLAYECLSDVVQMHSLDAEENAVSTVTDGGNVDGCGPETGMDLMVSSDCVPSGKHDVTDNASDPCHSREVRSGGSDVVMSRCQSSSSDLPSPPIPCLTYQPIDCSSDNSCCFSLPTTSSAFSDTSYVSIQPEIICKPEDQYIDKTDNQPFSLHLILDDDDDSNNSLPVAPQENGSTLLTNSSSGKDVQFHHIAGSSCADAASSSNPSLLPRDDFHSAVSEVFSAACSSTDQGQSASSDSVVDKSPASPADTIISDSIVEPRSPVGIDSSDSEVEWLETGKLGHHQRHISVSSGGSFIVCSLSDADVTDFVLSDSDDLEMFDDEPPTLRSDYQTDGSRHSPQTQSPPAGASSPRNNAILPASSNLSFSVGTSEVEPACISDQNSIKPLTLKLERWVDQSGHSYQIQSSSAQNGACLPSSSGMASSSMDVDGIDPAVTSGQSDLEQMSQHRVNDALLATATATEYSGDTVLQSSSVATERVHYSDVLASNFCTIQ